MIGALQVRGMPALAVAGSFARGAASIYGISWSGTDLRGEQEQKKGP